MNRNKVYLLHGDSIEVIKEENSLVLQGNGDGGLFLDLRLNNAEASCLAKALRVVLGEVPVEDQEL